MIRVVIGFIIGVIISRNAATMPQPVFAAVIFGAFLGFLAAYFFGRRDKNFAVATAVSVAVAKANAASEANAKAAASAAVNLVLMQNPATPWGYEPRYAMGNEAREEIVNESLKVLDSAADSSRVSNTDEDKDKHHVEVSSSGRRRAPLRRA